MINNIFIVGRRDAQTLTIASPPHFITKEEAINLAAWLVAIADDSEGNVVFLKLLETVKSVERIW